MAEVYDFTLYRLSRVLGSVSQQAGDVARQLESQERDLDRLEDGMRKMQDTMADVGGELAHQRERLAQSLAQNRSCREAADSHSLARMIAARDRLLHAKSR